MNRFPTPAAAADPVRYAAPLRRWRRHAIALGAALCLGAGGGQAAAKDAGAVHARLARLARLDSLVRGGDPAALPELLRVPAGDVGAAPYADQLQYLQLLAQAERAAGQTDAAYAVDARMAGLAAAHGDQAHAALGALGQAGRLLASDPAAALKSLGALDARYPQLRDPQFIATVQQLYGDVYSALGQFDFALGHYLKALDLARQHPDMLSPTVAGLRLAIARVYTYMHAPDKVLAALPDAAGAGLAPRARVRVFLYRGIADVMLGHPQRARDAYQQAIALARTHGLLVLEADLLANVADSYLHEQRYPEAEQAARAALALAQQGGDADSTRVATINLGFALIGEGRLAAGLKLMGPMVAQMRNAGTLPDLADLLGEESHALEHAGRAQEALTFAREQADILARLAASEREKTVAVLQEQFNAQQRAIQIEGLRRENLLKDREIQQRRVSQIVASGGAGLALLLCGFVYRLYRRSRRTQLRLEELNVELAFHSTHDALTGLLNRRSFREHMLAREGRPGPLPAECIILLDIDHFKAINDRHGHGAGDEVLVEAARRLRDTVGARGLVMRWGGEEFLVHVESIDGAGHAALVRELLQALAARAVTVEDGQAVRVTASAGALSLPACASCDARPGWQHAVAVADHALYKGKEGGRNRAYLAHGDTPEAATGLELILPDAQDAPDAIVPGAA